MIERWLMAAVMAATPALACFAWEGTTSDGSAIEVESYDHGGQGEGEVEYFDHSSGEYKSGYLDMYPGGSGTITDYETGESIEVDMD